MEPGSTSGRLVNFHVKMQKTLLICNAITSHDQNLNSNLIGHAGISAEKETEQGLNRKTAKCMHQKFKESEDIL